MNRSIILAAGIAAIAIVAGCSKGGNVQQQPGEWETTSRIKSIEVPGAPPEAQAQIRAQVGQTQTRRECLTEAQARDPMGQMRAMLAQGGPASACTFSDQTYSGGTIRIRGTCPAPGGQGSAQISVEGTYDATTMQGTMTMNAQAGANAPAGGPTGMNMTAEINGRRVGDCPAGGAAPAGNAQ